VRYNNLYYEVANPLFRSDGVDYCRAVLPSDPDGYLPDDLVVPYESARQLANDEPLTARAVRSACGFTRATFTRPLNDWAFHPPACVHSSGIRPGFKQNSMRRANAFSIRRKKSYSRHYSRMIRGVVILLRNTFSLSRLSGVRDSTR
jgi:hypothetical protein